MKFSLQHSNPPKVEHSQSVAAVYHGAAPKEQIESRLREKFGVDVFKAWPITENATESGEIVRTLVCHAYTAEQMEHIIGILGVLYDSASPAQRRVIFELREELKG